MPVGRSPITIQEALKTARARLQNSQHIYKRHTQDIYYCTTYTPENPSPKQITINGESYTRFLDFIYIPCKTHELSREQCIAVNDVRNIYFETHKDMAINRAVKQRISTVINQLCERRETILLEYGCGYQTIHSLLDANIHYIGADINHTAIEKNKALDPKANFVVVDDKQLPIRDKSIDILLSVFVFHFKISKEQLSELFRILSDNGVMIFNLYLLPKEQRQALFMQLEAIGFFCHREADSDRLCQDHEFCFISRSPNSSLLLKAIALFKADTLKPLTEGYKQFGLLADQKEETQQEAKQGANELSDQLMIKCAL